MRDIARCPLRRAPQDGSDERREHELTIQLLSLLIIFGVLFFILIGAKLDRETRFLSL